MAVGKAISNQDRKHICHIHITLRYSPERIHDILFRGTEISLEYMQKLCRKLHDRDFRRHYLLGPHRHSGRPRILSLGERQLVAQMAMDMKSFRVAKLREDFAALYYGNIQHCSSQSTILRTLRRAGLSRKTMERRHIQRNDVEGVLFLDTIAHRNPLFCVDIDGMACSRTDFFFKFGWAPVGERCVFQQIVINSQFYSVLAAVTPLGFLCWEIYNGTTASEQFVHFLENRVQPLLTVDNFFGFG